MERETDYSNIPQAVKDLLGKNLHNVPNHPLEIIKRLIYAYFDNMENYCPFLKFENLSPIVKNQNFDYHAKMVCK